MARSSSSPFTTIRSEGALLPPELLVRVTEGDKDLGGLAPSDYHLGENERLGEEISRSWNRLVGVWASFSPSIEGFSHNDPGTGTTRERWLSQLFEELRFGHLQVAKAREVDGIDYPISHDWNEVPIHLVGAGVELDHRSKGVAGAARMSPHALVQDYLNRVPDLWGIVSNGVELRLLRDNVSMTRQAFLAFDLEAMFTGEVYADFAVLWLTCHVSRFERQDGIAEDCWLERWTQAAQAQGTRALDALRDGVEHAISTLGAGFVSHTANADLRDALASGQLFTTDLYRELLRLVYRLIFLFVAEDRGLLHPPSTSELARARYHDYYSTARLRRIAERFRGGAHADMWRSLVAVCSSLGHDAGYPELGLPFLGSSLFSQESCTHLDASNLSNRDLLDAIRALAFTRQGRALRQIDYRNLGSEELGSIYESLLELHPEVHHESGTFTLATAPGHERKTTGSYYTPTPLIAALLDTALDPVLDEAAARPDAETAILNLKVLDPAAGSGHFLVAAAHRIAKRLAATRTDEREPSPDAYRVALREVISRCIFGIDVNPMAAELCKVSLWMEAVEPGKPLSFLAHHIVCGNSLLGTTPALLADGIPDDAFTPIEGDDKEVVKSLKKRNREERIGQATLFGEAAHPDLVSPIADGVAKLEKLADDSPEAMHLKEEAWEELVTSEEAAHARLIADAWCAAFLIDKIPDSPALTQGVLKVLERDPSSGDPKLQAAIASLADQFRFFHPHLAFPQVFRSPRNGKEAGSAGPGWSGGFDVVLGNPPWEKTTIIEREFFGTQPHIAEEKRSNRRKQLIQALQNQDPSLYQAWTQAKRDEQSLNHFLRDSGRFPGTAVGELNLYPLFVELAAGLIRETGRVGIVVKTGMLLSSTWAAFCAQLLEGDRIRAAYDFRNWKGWFPDVGYHERFTLLTLGARSQSGESIFGFYLDDPSETRDPSKTYGMSANEAVRLNPITKSVPAFATPKDKDVVTQIYDGFPILASEDAGWGLRYSTGFHMSADSAKFNDLESLLEEGYQADELKWLRRGTSVYVPLYEGKFIHQFDHRFGSFEGIPRSKRFGIKAATHSPDEGSKAESSYHITPRYWVTLDVAKQDAARRDLGGDWAVAFRDTTNVISNSRTAVACICAQVAYGNKVPNLILKPRIDVPCPTASLLFVALMNSMAFDYVARQKFFGVNLVKSMLMQLAVPPLTRVVEHMDFLLPRALELTYTSAILEPFALDLGHTGSPFRWNAERRALLRAELDAAFFRLYGLDGATVAYIIDTFPILRSAEEGKFGEYRTKRRVLDLYNGVSVPSRSHPTEEPSE